MKTLNLTSVILLLVIVGCGGGRPSAETDDGLITVDVTASYPKKELILQDFMNVEYIPLETTNEFLCEGIVQAIGKDIMLIKNNKDDGNIFVYDRKGKALKVINRKGKSGEEYTNIRDIILDEKAHEIFVNDRAGKILVYSLEGNFKRSIHYQQDISYRNIYNYDSENLIVYNAVFGDEKPEDYRSFSIISKQDGSITRNIHIPFGQKKNAYLMSIDEATKAVNIVTFNYYPVIPQPSDWILTEISSDTIYRLLPGGALAPFIIRNPSIQSMDPEVFLIPGIITDRYLFLETIKKENVFKTNTTNGFPRKNLMFDGKDRKTFEYIVLNNDYTNKKPVNMMQSTINNEIAFWQKIDSDDLMESLEKGHLKGKLKEIAEGLEEESNPIIMLVKYKK